MDSYLCSVLFPGREMGLETGGNLSCPLSSFKITQLF